MKKFIPLLFIVCVFGCIKKIDIKEKISRPREQRKPLFGILAPFNEKYRIFGEDIRDGALLAIGDSNVVTYNTESDPIKSVFLTKKLIKEDGVIGIIGPLFSNTTIASACVAQCYGVPFISPMATDERISLIGDFIYKLNSPSEAQNLTIADFAIQNLNIKNLAILYPDDSYGRVSLRLFSREVKNLGGRVIINIGYEPGESDFREELLKLRDAHPEGIFISAYKSDAKIIAPQLWYYQIANSQTIRILGNNSWGEKEMIRDNEKYLEGIFFTNLPESQKYSNFDTLFFERYKREPTKASLIGYCSMKLYKKALDDGVNTREELEKWLNANENLEIEPGISLSIEVCKRYITINTIKEGKLTTLKGASNFTD
jgi:branched-chain amino acid transport system substrate-binding protein